MITKQYIVPSLQALDTAYQSAATADDAERFAKLAIIELCGWIEETMDALILRCGPAGDHQHRRPGDVRQLFG